MMRAIDINTQIDTSGNANLSDWPQTTAGNRIIKLEDGEFNGIQVEGIGKDLCQMVFDNMISNASIKIGATEYDTPTDVLCGETNTMVFYVDDQKLFPEEGDDDLDSETEVTTTTHPETETETTTTVKVEEPEAVYCGWTDWINNDHPSTNYTGDDIETFDGVCKPENVKDIKCVSAVEPFLAPEVLGQKATCDKETGFTCKKDEQFGNGPFEICYDYKIKVFCCRTKPWDYLPE